MTKNTKFEKVAYVENGLPKIGYIVGKREGIRFTQFLVSPNAKLPLKEWIVLNGNEIVSIK